MSILKKAAVVAARGLLAVLSMQFANIPFFGVLLVAVWVWFAAGVLLR